MDTPHFLKENWMSAQDLLTRKEFYKRTQTLDDEEYILSLPAFSIDNGIDEFDLGIDPKDNYEDMINLEYHRLRDTILSYK